MGKNCAAVKSVVVWTRRRREKMPTKKKAAAVPAAIKAKIAANTVKEPTDPRFVREPKNFGIGNDMMPKTPLNRYVKWPKYVRIQRQRQVLKKRLRVPPAINQFTKTLDKNMATNLFKMLMKYRPEDNAQKKERLTDMAKDAAEGKESDVKKPVVVKYGINHITYLVEQGKAELVVIAHDVDPLELVIWLPALCQRMNVPYCIVKGKARLGAVVHKKTATALALTGIKNDDKTMRTWGGGIMGVKSQAKSAAKQRIIDKEEAQ